MWVERNGPSWRVRERVNGRKATLVEGFATKTAARDAMVQLAADALRGEALVPRGGELTVRELVELWWPDYVERLSLTARKSEGGRLRKHVLAPLGEFTIGAVTPAVVRDWVRDLAAGRGPVGEARSGRSPLAPKTVANCHGLLYVLMTFAVDRRYIRINPCVGTTLPERVHREMRCLTDAEIQQLLTALPEQWRSLVLLLVTTGLRWSEATGLKVGRLDLATRRPVVRVEEQLQWAAGRPEWVPPKSARSRRTVTLERSLVGVLEPLAAGRDGADPLFVTPQGMIRPHTFRRVWTSATRRAGLDGLRVHDLRHTHAAMLLSAGVSMEKVSRRLGHASLAVTDIVYGHLRPESDDAILAAVGASVAALDLSTLDAMVADELAA